MALLRNVRFLVLILVAVVSACGHHGPSPSIASKSADPFSPSPDNPSSGGISPAALAAIGGNVGMRSDIEVQIQPVRDQATLDHIRAGDERVDFASDWLQAKGGGDQKLAEPQYDFLIVVKNVGTTPTSDGTRTHLDVQRNGEVALSRDFNEKPLNPGQVAFHTVSVDCPDASDQLSIQATTDADQAVAGATHSAKLDVRTVR